ncbi:hypothetical protein OS187_03585 [Xanthomonadaceae bacterium JHOS43]|nr:hypothetical protein [Xanthomonadaceae bacterium JHOS43]
MIRGVAPPLRLTLVPSRAMRAVVPGLSLPAALAIHLSTMPDPVLLVLPVLAWHAWRAIGRGVPIRLVLRGDGRASCLDGNGDERSVQPLSLHERGPFGTLVLVVDGRRRDVLWAADTLPRATRRELRLWMRDHAHLRSGVPPEASTPGTPNA